MRDPVTNRHRPIDLTRGLPPPLDRLSTFAAAVGAGAGVLAMFFLDPDRGRRRRAVFADRLGGWMRRTGRQAERAARHASAEIYGAGQQIAHRNGDAGTPENDAELAHKVETELFRDPSIDKGHISINAENGTVVLRGTAETVEQIREIVGRVRRIHGVTGVDNRLHLPNTPAPPGSTPAIIH